MAATNADLTERVETLERQLAKLIKQAPADRVTIVAFNRDFDRVLTSFLVATAAAAMGSEVSMFFAFWGLSVLKKRGTRTRKKPITAKLLATMLPPGVGGTSQMNMLGMGPAFFRYLMKKKKVQSLEDLIETARASGVRMVACSMSMELMGISADELIDGTELGGVAACVGDACNSRATLFI